MIQNLFLIIFITDGLCKYKNKRMSLIFVINNVSVLIKVTKYKYLKILWKVEGLDDVLSERHREVMNKSGIVSRM